MATERRRAKRIKKRRIRAFFFLPLCVCLSREWRRARYNFCGENDRRERARAHDRSSRSCLFSLFTVSYKLLDSHDTSRVLRSRNIAYVCANRTTPVFHACRPSAAAATIRTLLLPPSPSPLPGARILANRRKTPYIRCALARLGLSRDFFTACGELYTTDGAA